MERQGSCCADRRIYCSKESRAELLGAEKYGLIDNHDKTAYMQLTT
jgi:hypothetical protein